MQMRILALLCLAVVVIHSGTAFAQFNLNLRLNELQESEYGYITHTYFHYHADHTDDLDSLITIAVNPNTQAAYTKHRRIYHYSDERLEQMEHWSTSFVNMETWYERYDYSYNDQGRLASVIMHYSFPDDPVLNPGFRKHYLYGTMGGQPCLQQVIDKTFEPPNPYARTTYYYQSTANGHRLHYEETWAAWDSTSWEPSVRHSYYYLPADTSDTETILDHETKSALWQYETPGLNYLSKGLLDHINSYEAWGNPNDVWWWELRYSTEYTYNNSNQLVQVIFEDPWYEYNYTFSWGTNGCPATYDYFGPSGYAEHYAYVWGPDTANQDPVLPTPAAMTINAFPNPFSVRLNIQVSDKNKQPFKGEIFNLKGSKVQSFTLSGDNKFIWNGKDLQGKTLPSGIYLIRISGAGKQAAQKVLLLK